MKNIKKVLAVGLIGTMGLAFVGCSQSSKKDVAQKNESVESIEITHESGTTQVPVNPERVAVLDMALLDIVDTLGGEESVVGVPKSTKLVDYLVQYEDETIENLGTVKEIDMEALNALDPDVILIGGRLAEYYDDFAQIAPTLNFALDHEEGYMTSLENNVKAIAKMYDKEAEAAEILEGFNDRIEVLKAAKEMDATAVVAMVSKGSISALGPKSRTSIISNEMGFNNLVQTDSTHGDSVSFEFLVEQNPEYMFVLDRDAAIGTEGAKLAKDIIENELVMGTDAYKNGKVVYLTPGVWYLLEGGLQATDLMLQDIENELGL